MLESSTTLFVAALASWQVGDIRIVAECVEPATVTQAAEAVGYEPYWLVSERYGEWRRPEDLAHLTLIESGGCVWAFLSQSPQFAD